MEFEGSVLHSEGLSNSLYPEPNKCVYPHAEYRGPLMRFYPVEFRYTYLLLEAER